MNRLFSAICLALVITPLVTIQPAASDTNVPSSQFMRAMISAIGTQSLAGTNTFGAACGLDLSDSDFDHYINPSVTGSDRRLAHRLMRIMPSSQRGDFVVLMPGGRLLSNNPAILNYVHISVAKPANDSLGTRQMTVGSQTLKPGLRPRLHIASRGTSTAARHTDAGYSSSCSPPDPPGAAGGPYIRDVSQCGFTTGWGFVNVPCGTSQFASGDAGHLYFLLQGSGYNTTYGKSLEEGGLEYYGDSSVAPYLRVYDGGPNGYITMNNNSVRYACGQNLAIMHGATTDAGNGEGNYTYTETGQVPTSLNPQSNWVNYGQFTLNNASWLFNSVAGDVVGPGVDFAGVQSPCMTCSISKVTSIAENGLPGGTQYQMDGSTFGISSLGESIHWMQVAFREWERNCTPGTTLCTFAFSSDPTRYMGGSQNFPDSFTALTFSDPLGWGAYESYDGIDLFGVGVPASQARAGGSYSEPPPPMPCTPDPSGYCVITQSRSASSSCNTGSTNVHGVPIIIYGYSTRYSIYSSASYPRYVETATSTQTESSNDSGVPPCISSVSWTPGEPRIQFGDTNLP